MKMSGASVAIWRVGVFMVRLRGPNTLGGKARADRDPNRTVKENKRRESHAAFRLLCAANVALCFSASSRLPKV